DGVDGKSFFEQAVKDVQMGFFADPIYGGDRDMVGWKMIGYPGARYNYLDWVDRHNEPFPLPPVSITGRAEWTPKTRGGAVMACGFRKKTSSLSGWAGPARSWRTTSPTKGSMSLLSSVAPGATRRPISRRTTCRTNCAIAFATSCSCGRTRPRSRSATRWTKPRC